MKLTITLILEGNPKGDEIGFAIRRAAKEASAYCERSMTLDGCIPINKARYLIDSTIAVKCLVAGDIVREE